ncbi:unnamed protein product [Nippostrongylus brasiliensis]|uniref:E3 ubiquitin-protein ligase n=1 Tax=Nippostrongylus brasiliensis TaxID=27835 RepID=A0A0N4YAR8_NIPBR|nr:unnamed protein product [Nippostrongylus brasiliensis]
MNGRAVSDTVMQSEREGNICEEEADAICLTVNSTLEHSSSVFRAISKAAGGGNEYKTAYVNARKNVSHWLSRGEVLVVDVSATELRARYVFLVVHPDIHHLERAYRSVFHEAAARDCSSVVIPGLGCGAIGNSVQSTCTVACSVLYDLIASNSLGSLKVIRFVDIKEAVERQFAIQLSEKFSLKEGDPAATAENNNAVWQYAKPAQEVQQDDCVICLSSLSSTGDVCELSCGHQYHVQCFSNYLKSANSKKCCALCGKFFDLPLGDQPKEATMTISKNYKMKLPGHENSEFTYTINYIVPNGIQEASHIRPGRPYSGTHRICYVPGTEEGKQVLRLLKFAFERRLIFTVGDSITTGARNQAVWNNIHHKTNVSGGPQKYGYPDPDYLTRVKEDLAAKGITVDMLPSDMDI